MSEFFDTTGALKMGLSLDEFLADYPGAEHVEIKSMTWRISGRIVHAHVDGIPLNVNRVAGLTFVRGWINGDWVYLAKSFKKKMDITKVAGEVRRKLVREQE